MKKTIFLIFLMCFCATIMTFAQKPKVAPAYKITNIKIVPFNEQTGEFEATITPKSERSFFNDLSISLMVSVEITGEAGSFEVGRKVEVTVTEGKKIKTKKIEQVGLIGEGGKYYYPIFLNSAMCDQVKITARLIGQKTPSTMSRSIPFMCSE